MNQSDSSHSSLDDILRELEEKFSNPEKKDTQIKKKSSRFNFQKLSQNQIIGTITLVMLIVGGLVGALLGQQEQDIRQRAANTEPYYCTNDAGWCRGGIQPGESCTTWWIDPNGTCVLVNNSTDTCDCVVLGQACCGFSDSSRNHFTDYQTCKSQGGTQTRPELCQNVAPSATSIPITRTPTNTPTCQPGTQQSTHRICQGNACVTVDNSPGVCDTEENNSCDTNLQCVNPTTPPQNTQAPVSTNTPVPRATNTSVPTTPGQATNTPVPNPTNTSVPLSTNTLRPTNTANVTSTPRSTNTPIPTSAQAELPPINTNSPTRAIVAQNNFAPTNTPISTTTTRPTTRPTANPTIKKSSNLPSAGNGGQNIQIVLGLITAAVFIGAIGLLFVL